MNKADLFAKILSEASGQPLDYARFVVLMIGLKFGVDTNTFLAEIPKKEARQLLAKFRKEKAGIFNWLIAGGFRARQRLSLARSKA